MKNAFYQRLILPSPARDTRFCGGFAVIPQNRLMPERFIVRRSVIGNVVQRSLKMAKKTCEWFDGYGTVLDMDEE